MKLYYDDICFNNKRIIESGFINIYKNKIIVICGPNGSGKSSLVKNAILNEKNNDLGIIYVNQNNDMLIAEMSIIENITMSSEKEYNLKIEQEIKDLGFDYLLDKDIKKLSGGEKRLLTLMRGFFSKESILLIDEPTNDLDYVIVNQVIDILKKIKSKKQIVMISHDNRIKEIADTIYKIKNCKLELSQNDKEQCIPNQENIDSNIKKDIKIIEKMFKKNYISVLILLSIFSWLGMHCSLSFCDNSNLQFLIL